jgi:hypothetical protein
MAIHIIDGRAVRTHNEFPPIPVRKFDWFAVDDSAHDGEGPIGMGASEQEAIEDLLEQIDAGHERSAPPHRPSEMSVRSIPNSNTQIPAGWSIDTSMRT